MPERSALEDRFERIKRVEARINFHRRHLRQETFFGQENTFARTVLHTLERSLKIMRLDYDRLACKVRQRQEQENKKAESQRRLRNGRVASTADHLSPEAAGWS